MFDALSAVGSEEAALAELSPAAPIKRSVTDDYIICLEDGRKLKMLKRHLMTSYGMTPEVYRAKWGLKADYPMVAPAYARKRQKLAGKIGLGRKPRRRGCTGAARMRDGRMKPTGKLAALAEREGFLLVPKFDRRLFTVSDQRVMEIGTKVYVDGEELRNVTRAYVGEGGWADFNPEDENGRPIFQDGEFVVDRKHGSPDRHPQRGVRVTDHVVTQGKIQQTPGGRGPMRFGSV